MKKRFSAARLRYLFDCRMSKGPLAMTGLLFRATIAAVVIFGLLAFLFGGGGLGYQLWMGLMHTIDPGTLAGNDTANIPYLITMTCATFFGLFLTSILIGIISSSIEAKLHQLRRGSSVVQEYDHSVIIGFDDNVFTIVSELIEANANRKDACIVILGEQDKEEMDDAISAHFPDTRGSRIVCRNGGLADKLSLERCAVENCRSVIINNFDDAEVIKSVLALSSYLEGKELHRKDLHITAVINDYENVEAAEIAGKGRAEIIFANDAVSRIIAHTCRQHGLSHVLMDIFDFQGDEIYFETVNECVGKSFKECMNMFSNAVVMGICQNGTVMVNPPMDTLINAGDKLILMEEDDGAFKLCTPKSVTEEAISHNNNTSEEYGNMLIFGSNEKLPAILKEYDLCAAVGTVLTVVDDDAERYADIAYKNITLRCVSEKVEKALLETLLTDDIRNVLILNDDSLDFEKSDALTLLRLILIRNIADKAGLKLAITSEMKFTRNQQLASSARVDDFVIGNNIMCLLMTQISENRSLARAINTLLSEEGSEFYMKPAANYVPLGTETDGFCLTESAARKGEIFVGYRLHSKENCCTVINPDKNDTLVFEENDLVIVVAENMN